MKKILSLVLVIALVLGSFSFAFAAPADVEGTDYEKAVEVLMALDVVRGFPDGSFRPGNTITRAEMVTLIVRALGYDELAGGSAPFSDTKGHWAEGYINLANGLGIVLGYPDGTFRPNATLTFDEATAIVVRALGYTDDVLRGTWPTNYRIKALELGLLGGTTGQMANRGNVAVMLYNALEARLVEVIQTQTGLFAFRFIERADSTATSPKFRTLLDKVGSLVPEFDVTYERVFGTAAQRAKTAIDLEPYLYHTVEAYRNAAGEIAFVVRKITSEWSDKLEADAATTGNIELSFKDGTGSKTFNVDGAPFFFNGTQARTSASDALLSNLKKGTEVTVVYEVVEGVTNIIGVKAWQETEVQLIENVYVADAKNIDGIDLPDADDKVDLSKVTVIGDAESVTDIAKNDVVHVFAADNNAKVKLQVVRETVEGVISARTTDWSKVTIDGVRLDNVAGDLEVVLNSEITVALNKDGAVFAVLVKEEAVQKNYAVVIGYQAEDTDTVLGVQVVILGKIRLLVESGDQVVYEIKEGYTPEVTEKGAFVTYKMTDGKISEVTEVTGVEVDGTFNKTTKVLAGEWLVTADTIIFNRTDDVATKWNVLASTGVGANVTGQAVVDSNGKVEVLVVEDMADAPVVEAGKYAIATDVQIVRVGTTDIERVTAFVNGVVTTLDTNATGLFTGNTYKFVEYDLVDGKVDAVTPELIKTTHAVQAVSGNLIRVDGVWHEVSANAVVYQVTYNNATPKAVNGVQVISASDITTSMFVDVQTSNLIKNADGVVTTIIVSATQITEVID